MSNANDKRSDLACPMIIGRRSTSQARETNRISDGFAKKLDRETSAGARAIHERNNDFLATKRRAVQKGRKS